MESAIVDPARGGKMRTKYMKWLFLILAGVGMLLLSACKANFITDIQADGSGSFTEEFGMTQDEMDSYEITADDLCSSMTEGSDIPVGASVNQETRGEETWCVIKIDFASLDDLNTLYNEMEVTVGDLRIVDGQAFYDVTIDLGGESSFTGFLESYWIVTMPGSISEHNADEKDGNTLTWSLTSGDPALNAHAVSQTSGGGSTIWWVVGGAAACLCLLVIVAAVVVVIVLVVKKNKARAGG
jgi:hypothetical protein